MPRMPYSWPPSSCPFLQSWSQPYQVWILPRSAGSQPILTPAEGGSQFPWERFGACHGDAHRPMMGVYNQTRNASFRPEKHHHAGWSGCTAEEARETTGCLAERTHRPSCCRRTRNGVWERRPTSQVSGVDRRSGGPIGHGRYDGLRRWPSSLTAACLLQPSTEATDIMLGRRATSSPLGSSRSG